MKAVGSKEYAVGRMRLLSRLPIYKKDGGANENKDKKRNRIFSRIHDQPGDGSGRDDCLGDNCLTQAAGRINFSGRLYI